MGFHMGKTSLCELNILGSLSSLGDANVDMHEGDNLLPETLSYTQLGIEP